jgi:ABC-type multidrug transport system ATPase subunit
VPVEVRDLVVQRGTIRAVDGVSFRFQPGCWTGIVGANGSGKTSLMRAIAGRLEIASGMIAVEGTDRTGDRAWRAGFFGFAPDASSLPESLTGGELFAIVASGQPGLETGDALAGLRQALDFDTFLHRRIGTLSGGMRQRLALFSAFLRRPRVVLLDEPFNWLDPVCAFDTKRALTQLVEDGGLTLITALHDMATLLHRCHSGLLLSDSRIRRILDADDLKSGALDYASFETEMIGALRSRPL